MEGSSTIGPKIMIGNTVLNRRHVLKKVMLIVVGSCKMASSL
jgi:hypothetical protein